MDRDRAIRGLQGARDAHVEYDAAGPLALGLEALTTDMCYGKGVYTACPQGRHTPLGNTSDGTSALCGVLECGGLEYMMTLMHISYFYSIEHLWIQPGTPGAHVGHDPNGYYPGRPAAARIEKKQPARRRPRRGCCLKIFKLF